MFLTINVYAGMDFSMLGGQWSNGDIPEFHDKYDAILYGLQHNEEKDLIQRLTFRINDLEHQLTQLSFESNLPYEQRRKWGQQILSQIHLVEQCEVAANDKMHRPRGDKAMNGSVVYFGEEPWTYH